MEVDQVVSGQQVDMGFKKKNKNQKYFILQALLDFIVIKFGQDSQVKNVNKDLKSVVLRLNDLFKVYKIIRNDV
jgi:hypothetical protein